MTKKPAVALSREEELNALRVQVQKVKNDRAYGIKLAQQAGILTKSGRLASYYKQKA